MAESYTTPHSLPILGTADLVRSPTGDNLRLQLNALSTAANTAITAEGSRAESAAKSYTDTKDTANRAAWASADTSKLAEAKSYTDTKDTANRSAWTAADASNKAALDATDAANLSTAKTYTDTREAAVRDDLAISNVDLDTDGIPFIRFGSRTAKILQDTDGAPYYEAA